MKRNLLFTTLLLTAVFSAQAQLTPEITSWIINTTGATGYAGILTNVQQVQYSANNVYVSVTCIPGYDIGPWLGNPNIPSNQNFVFKITRTPAQNTGTPTAVGLGHIGVWSNGVSIFNAKDGMSYNNAGAWNRNALFYEGASFDSCLGHPAPNGEYHHHVNPRCLYDEQNSTNHSPIIGYAFDGFPIYGAYGYSDTNGTGVIKRMKSSYVLSTATTRTNGPAVNSSYPTGCFVEDYTYTSGAGDLDAHNGRFCVTPDYPNGIYAYFVTIDDSLYPTYPFVIGTSYYGTVQAGNTGPNSGHNTISETVTSYTGINEVNSNIHIEYFPNPASNYLTIFVKPNEPNNIKARITDFLGQTVLTQDYIQPAVLYTFDLSKFSNGVYYLQLSSKTASTVQKIMIIK